MSREKLGLAMEFMYDSDPTFRAAVEALVPELREGKKVGGVRITAVTHTPRADDTVLWARRLLAVYFRGGGSRSVAKQRVSS